VQSLFDIVNAVIIFCGSEIENLFLELTRRILHILDTQGLPTCSN